MVALPHDRHFLTGTWCTSTNCLAVLVALRLPPSQIPHGKNKRPVKNCRFGFYRFISSIRKMVTLKKPSKKRKEKVGSSNGGGNGVQKRNKDALLGFRKVKRRVENPTRFQRQCMHTSGRLMSPRESVRNHVYQKVMKITSQAKDTIRCHVTMWYKHLLRCLKR